MEAGKFDNGLLNSIRQAKNFVLVLTPNALERCVEDNDCKDWVHRVSVVLKENLFKRFSELVRELFYDEN